jgi:hypothetical protein
MKSARLPPARWRRRVSRLLTRDAGAEEVRGSPDRYADAACFCCIQELLCHRCSGSALDGASRQRELFGHCFVGGRGVARVSCLPVDHVGQRCWPVSRDNSHRQAELAQSGGESTPDLAGAEHHVQLMLAHCRVSDLCRCRRGRWCFVERDALASG